MPKFRIVNITSGTDLGVYEADDHAAALDALARYAGYVDYAKACHVLSVQDREIVVDKFDEALSESDEALAVEGLAAQLCAENSGTYVWRHLMREGLKPNWREQARQKIANLRESMPL